MATTTNPNRTSLAGRVAAEKRQAAETKQLQMRVASAWTLAKTMIPTAPADIQIKLAKNLLLNGTRELKAMLRQAAVNAHYTHLAEEYKNVMKKDLNDLMEDPSVLRKEEAAVLSEIKGDPKNAGKKADDRKENDVQPATYDEGKRKEPTDMDADDAGDRSKIDLELKEGVKGKESSAKKKACGDDCKGCPECEGKKKDASKKDDGKKEAVKITDSLTAASKKDAAKKMADEDEEAEPEAKEAAKKAKPEVDTKKAEKKDAAPAKKKAEDEEPAEEAPAESEPKAEEEAFEEGEEAAEVGDEVDDNPFADEEEAGEEGEEAEEVFDEEKVTLQDAIEDVKRDVETLTDAIEEEIGSADEINLAELGFDEAADAEMEVVDPMADQPMPEAGVEGEYPGEELNIDDIFNEDNFADKVSALSNEGEEMVDEIGMEYENFFAPSDPAELEGALDEEEALMSPVDMFAVDGVKNDPLAMLLASVKQAADSETILKPGTLDKHFETELAGDDRDWDSDHDQDIFADVYKHLPQPERGDTRDAQDAEPELKEPTEAKQAGKGKAPAATKPSTQPVKQAVKTTAPVQKQGQPAPPVKQPAKQAVKQASYPKLAPHFDPLKDVAKLSSQNLATALFPDEAEYM